MKTIKGLISWAVLGVALNVGCRAGIWLWDEVLEDKADDAVRYLKKKFKKEGA